MRSARVERFGELRVKLLVVTTALLSLSCSWVGRQQATDSAQQRPQMVVEAQR